MYDKTLVLGLLDEIEEAFRRIDRRFSMIPSPDDFLDSDDGLDRLDGIAMMLIAIGENIKKVDKITKGKLLEVHPEIQWPGVKGVRDVLAHDYFSASLYPIGTQNRLVFPSLFDTIFGHEVKKQFKEVENICLTNITVLP